MSLTKRYQPQTVEPRLLAYWDEQRVYHFAPQDPRPVFSIDTPPPTVSGQLHLGHVYSYTHADLIARFWRMNGHNVFYPMGFDDNGLPTERLVEKTRGITARQVGRQAFIQACLQVSEEAEKDYRAIWRRLGLSVDWRYSYRTIDDHARKTAQLSFIQLYKRGLAYQRQAPTIWCPQCSTAIAQAEVNDLERQSELITIAFKLKDGDTLPIATTRPELLPACVAVFVHPDDQRYTHLVGQQAAVPLFDRLVPILTDPAADPHKGTGAVMCCTFGDTADVQWWYTHQLPLKVVIDPQGMLNEAAGAYAGLQVAEARGRITADLHAAGLLLDRQTTHQTVRLHERCDTPVEYLPTRQWFIKALDFKDELLKAGEHITWHPPHMGARYRSWVENLAWDWCISRQRYFGVPFPLWYCDECGHPLLAAEDQLPIDPLEAEPDRNCAHCGAASFTPESDVMDTWATSAHTPQLATQWLSDQDLFEALYPMSLRPQAHEIIRTWAFYTILKALHHQLPLPWKQVAISGWGIAAQGAGKISKSRGGGPMPPLEMIQGYSADAVRYWAASTGLGKDAVIDEGKIQAGAKLVTKLWNVARFSQRFLEAYTPTHEPPLLTPADRWILARKQEVIARASHLFRQYEYATAKSEAENFFWNDLADNYLEMAKQRLYDQEGAHHHAACFTLHHALLATVKLFAPFLPFVTEEVYLNLFASFEGCRSVHLSPWPQVNAEFIDPDAVALGQTLVEIATAVRRYKSQHNLPLASPLRSLQLATHDGTLAAALSASTHDLTSITRAHQVQLSSEPLSTANSIPLTPDLHLTIIPD